MSPPSRDWEWNSKKGLRSSTRPSPGTGTDPIPTCQRGESRRSPPDTGYTMKVGKCDEHPSSETHSLSVRPVRVSGQRAGPDYSRSEEIVVQIDGKPFTE